jgi:hypothetical protein
MFNGQCTPPYELRPLVQPHFASKNELQHLHVPLRLLMTLHKHITYILYASFHFPFSFFGVNSLRMSESR